VGPVGESGLLVTMTAINPPTAPYERPNYCAVVRSAFIETAHLGSYFRKKINKPYSLLGIIKRNFIHMDEHTFTLLYKAMVRSHVEFDNSVWCPFKLGDIKEIEKSKRELQNS